MRRARPPSNNMADKNTLSKDTTMYPTVRKSVASATYSPPETFTPAKYTPHSSTGKTVSSSPNSSNNYSKNTAKQILSTSSGTAGAHIAQNTPKHGSTSTPASKSSLYPHEHPGSTPSNETSPKYNASASTTATSKQYQKQSPKSQHS